MDSVFKKNAYNAGPGHPVHLCSNCSSRYEGIQRHNFLFLHNLKFGDSLEMPRWGISNEYPQRVFELEKYLFLVAIEQYCLSFLFAFKYIGYCSLCECAGWSVLLL